MSLLVICSPPGALNSVLRRREERNISLNAPQCFFIAVDREKDVQTNEIRDVRSGAEEIRG